MKKLPTLTVVIPAYNEASNLRHLLSAILTQSHNRFQLQTILIISDGSTDETKVLARKNRDPRIKFHLGKTRLGKPMRLNQAFKLVHSEILVVLDADTKLIDQSILDRLATPFTSGSKLMVSGHVEPAPATNFVERIAAAGVGVWTQARSLVAKDSLYHCDGMIRAFSKYVYQHMVFADNSAEDSYSYLYVKSHGWQFIAVKDAVVEYHLPSTLSDYFSQQRRYLTSVDIMTLNFPPDFILHELTITPSLKLVGLFRYFASDPFYTLLYLLCSVLVRLSLILFKPSHSAKWQILNTTKKVNL